jgi:hypothetical protein
MENPDTLLQMLWLEPWMADLTDIPDSCKRPYFPQCIYFQEDMIYFQGVQYECSYKVHQWDILHKMYQTTYINPSKTRTSIPLTSIHSSIMGQMTTLIPKKLFLMDVWSGSHRKTSPRYLLIYTIPFISEIGTDTKTEIKRNTMKGLLPKRMYDILEDIHTKNT